ncbi:MAG: hypothetical protein A2201_12070 [Alicyclobacillus sp. RIFOXYA1_FULL_53_8]|nr:MAG: hypothetical protein A2201_12070 [Alicyclobacillus sp. RIFOXYA1_FULL_53_8]
MKICHFPRGWPMLEECKALKSIGQEAHAYDFLPHKFFSPADYTLHLQRAARDQLGEKIGEFIDQVKDKYDVFHLHMMLAYANPYCPKVEHLSVLKSLGKKMVVEHHGSDARRMSLATKNNPYFRERRDYVGEARIVSSLRQLATVFDHAVLHDYELVPDIQEFYPHVHVIPYPFDVSFVSPAYPQATTHEPLIVHAPSDPYVKGTDYVLDAVSRLRKAGYEFTFQLVQNLHNNQAIDLYRKADIVIDQLCIGAHGIVSLEAMAYGKPVVCYIKEELVGKYPKDLPIVNANPDTLERVLASLLDSPRDLHELGQKGRAYVEAHHDPTAIAQQWADLYEMC